jgi:diaminohydroxyphosphoribosylaminopyrimidine deaminase/5-amino-6-(5-phosphoribosylamino)uracil reductase
MTADLKEDYFMGEALKLAKKGAGRVSPNPMVGAVIVKNSKIKGKGFHRFFGGAHAEINALESAGKEAQGADIYITLEPCSHFGKTPPCVDALINSGIRRVFIGMVDPNPAVSGKGIRKLEKSGISVKTGILENECRRLNESFIKYITKKEPFVILKSAASLDGKIASHTGDSKWITCEKSRKLVHRMRFESDAVMVGVGTVIADDPLLTVRMFKKAKKEPFRVIIDSGLKIPLASNVLKPQFAEKTIIAVSKEKALSKKADTIKKMGAQVIAVPSKNKRIDLKKLSRILAKQEIASILIEGGSEVNSAALEAGIIDKVMFFYAPLILGGKKSFGMIGGQGKALISDSVKIDGLKIRRVGSDFVAEGYVV